MRRGLRQKGGFSLVEVMIAVPIAAIALVTLITSMTFNARASRLNSNRLAAKNIAQGYIERMQAAPFANVGPADPTNLTWKGLYLSSTPLDLNYDATNAAFPISDSRYPYFSNIIATTNPPVYLDEGLAITCLVTFQFKGFGRATGGTTTSLTDTTAAWTPGEWVGSWVYIVGPNLNPAQSEFAKITANSATTLTVQEDPANPNDGFTFAPNAQSIYLINHGKTVTVTTQWSYLGNNYTQTMQALIPKKYKTATPTAAWTAANPNGQWAGYGIAGF